MPDSYVPSFVRDRLCLPRKYDAPTMKHASPTATRTCSASGTYCQMYGLLCIAIFECRSAVVKGQGERLRAPRRPQSHLHGTKKYPRIGTKRHEAAPWATLSDTRARPHR